MKLTRGPTSRQVTALVVLAVVSSAAHYAGLAAHARAWWWGREDQDRSILENFQHSFVQCVGEKGMGLDAIPVDECRVKLVFTDESAAVWRDPNTGELEGLVYEFDLCRMIILWVHVRNSSTILTKEYIDGLPNGWQDYAWKRINKGNSQMCRWNVTRCKEKLALVVPEWPPFCPGQYRKCAVVGNSGDLLQDLLGAEIDAHDVVVRMNGAPLQNYKHYVGEKTTFRILNRGSAKALDKVAALGASGKETLIIKTTIHDTMNQMIREVPIRNPVYLMVGAPLGQGSAKGTGIKAIEFAMSVCKQVDIYGYTVDPGYLEWTRYFSDARKGHAPLQGRAYYQAMECLGLIRIRSPQRRVSASTQHDMNLNSMVRNAAAAHLSMRKK